MDTHIPARLPALQDFSHDARLLIIVSGLTAVSFFGIHSLLRSLYVLRLGYGPAYVGAYLASGALTFMVMGIPSGVLGQRFGTRKVMLAGGWITAGGMLLLPGSELLSGRARDLWPFVSQIVLTIGWSMHNVNIVPALMAVTHDFNRSSAYALTSALRGVGTFLGTLLGGALPELYARLLDLDPGLRASVLDSPTPYSYALLTGGLLSLLAIAPLGGIQGGQPTPSGSEAERQRGPFPFLAIAAMIVYVLLRHTSWTTCQAFCYPYLDEGLALSTSAIGVLTSIGQLAAIMATLSMPSLARRWHHGWIIVLSTALLATSLALLSLTPHWSAAGLGLLGVQVSAALWLPALQVFQMELVNEGWRALSYGAVTMAMGLGFGTMSLFGGYLIEAQGYSQLFAIGIALALASTILMAAITRVLPPGHTL